MKIVPASFRPRFSDFWQQAIGCSRLGCVLPSAVGVALVVSLPWDFEMPSEVWWAGVIRGALIGIALYILFICIAGLVKRRFTDLQEAREATRQAQETLDRAKEYANFARLSATNGYEWVEQSLSCFTAPEYIPFWEATENAKTSLQRCCESLAVVQGCRLRYLEILGERSHTFPDIDEEIGLLFDPRPDMQRLTEVVRMANRDRDFSTIFAQMTTTHAIREGFGQLAAAVKQLEISMTEAVKDLKTSLVREIRRSTVIQAKILQGVRFIATGQENVPVTSDG